MFLYSVLSWPSLPWKPWSKLSSPLASSAVTCLRISKRLFVPRGNEWIMHRNKMTNAVKVKRMVMRSRTGHITEQQEIVGHQGSWIEESRRSLDRDPRLNQPHTPLYSFHPLGIMKSLCVAPQGNRRIECVRDEIRDWKYGNQKEVRKSSCLRRAHNRLDFRPLTWLTTERWIRVAFHPPCPVLQAQNTEKGRSNRIYGLS